MPRERVAVCIPSIPPRANMLKACIASVLRQTYLVDEICVAIDNEHQGAAVTRNRAWRMSTAPWCAFLDDDDTLYTDHLQVLLAAALEHEADMTYSWFDISPNSRDPFPDTHFTEPWDPTDPRQTTITCLWRRSALEKVGGFPEEFDDAQDGGGNRAGEDFQAVLALNEWGTIVHVPKRTWLWNHHGFGQPGVSGNTSGLGSRW